MKKHTGVGKHLKIVRVFCCLWMAAMLAQAQPKELRPGFNLFTARQDIQVGQESAAEVEKQKAVVRNPEVDAYLNSMLRKLERSPYARTLERGGARENMFPFTIHAIYDKNINAFSLPGGPIYINTGIFDAADNEAQLAGVISHEMSHIVLRHGTNQASKQNLIELPALLAGALAGGSMLGQLAQLGIGLGANSVLLKFSRTDEAQADYNGAEIMADAGYNPLELGRFFEKLEAKNGRESSLEEFLSDHPNPGNRVEAIDDEIRQLPRRNYVDDETGQFQHIKDVVRRLPGATAPGAAARGPAPAAPTDRPGSRLRSYSGRSYSFQYPDNWQVQTDRQGDAVTIAPPSGIVQAAGGQTLIGYGLQADYFAPQDGSADLNGDTQALIRQLRQSNPDMRVGRDTRNIEVAGRPALLTTLYSRSPYRGEQEVDALVTVARPEGLFYVVFIAPQSLFDQIQPAFEDMLRSIRFP